MGDADRVSTAIAVRKNESLIERLNLRSLVSRKRAIDDAEFDADARSGLILMLISVRNYLGLSQRDIAKRMGTQQSAVSDLEKGTVDPRISTMQRYARAVGCRVDLSLMPDTDADDDSLYFPALNEAVWAQTKVVYESANVHSADEHVWFTTRFALPAGA